MVQTVKSTRVYPGQNEVLLEKPMVLRRTSYSIKVLTDLTMGHKSHISFDDPNFFSYYILDGSVQELEAKGEGIFQGTIWVHNASSADLVFTITETLV